MQADAACGSRTVQQPGVEVHDGGVGQLLPHALLHVVGHLLGGALRLLLHQGFMAALMIGFMIGRLSRHRLLRGP